MTPPDPRATSTPFQREIRRLTLGALLVFGVVALAAAYWAITGADTILLRTDNPRRVEQEAARQRGAIVDRAGGLLAATVVTPAGVQRVYPQPAAASAVGYASLRYGVGGVEAAFNRVLRGDTLTPPFSTALTAALLGSPVIGSDIQVTLDPTVQTALYAALAGQRGAAVVISVPDGAVLGLVSLPDYDPHQLDANWDTLRTDPAAPLLNRAVDRAYPAGALTQTPLLAAALLLGTPIDQPQPDATAPVRVAEQTIGCALPLPPLELTLSEAYAFACPAPFANLSSDLGANAIAAALDTFRLDTRPDLLALDQTAAPLALLPEATVPPDADRRAALGYSLGTYPLTAALMAAAVVNDGNAPQPYLLIAQRPPGGAWENVPALRPTIPLATVDTARRLQDLMRRAVAEGAAQNAGRPDIDIGGHAALAVLPDGEPIAWFIGFATLAGRQGAAVAVVLEAGADVGLAADIGGTALVAARDALLIPPGTPPSAASPQPLTQP